MGSATAASLMPSTGEVSAPVSLPVYSKVQVLVLPLARGVARVKRTVELVERRSEVRAAFLASRTLGELEAVVELEGGGGDVVEGGEGDDGDGGEFAGGGDEVGGDVVGGDVDLLARGWGGESRCGSEKNEREGLEGEAHACGSPSGGTSWFRVVNIFRRAVWGIGLAGHGRWFLCSFRDVKHG